MLPGKQRIEDEQIDWEFTWAPYDPPTYREVLRHISPKDVVLEIGAGDLRLALQAAATAQHVYAIEIQSTLVSQALNKLGHCSPSNLTILCADARHLPFPGGITVAILLMRHCSHFRLYVEKLKSIGCRRLVTNARWRMGVEVVDLVRPRLAFDAFAMGWYACWCGAAGFKPGPVEKWNDEMDRLHYEVAGCPACQDPGGVGPVSNS